MLGLGGGIDSRGDRLSPSEYKRESGAAAAPLGCHRGRLDDPPVEPAGGRGGSYPERAPNAAHGVVVRYNQLTSCAGPARGRYPSETLRGGAGVRNRYTWQGRGLLLVSCLYMYCACWIYVAHAAMKVCKTLRGIFPVFAEENPSYNSLSRHACAWSVLLSLTLTVLWLLMSRRR